MSTHAGQIYTISTGKQHFPLTFLLSKENTMQHIRKEVMRMLEKYKDVLTVKDLSEILPLGKTSIYKLLSSNAIKNIRVGTKILIPKQYVIEYLQTAC